MDKSLLTHINISLIHSYQLLICELLDSNTLSESDDFIPLLSSLVSYQFKIYKSNFEIGDFLARQGAG